MTAAVFQGRLRLNWMVRGPKLDHHPHTAELHQRVQYINQANTALREDFAQLVSEKRLKNYINEKWQVSKCLNALKWKTLYVGAE